MMVAFSERTLRLVLRDDQAKLAEMKLRIKGADLELANILNFPPACALFEQYMIGEHAPENLFFWKAVERFEDICSRLDKQLEKLKNGEEIPIRKTVQVPGTASSMRLKTTASVSSKPLTHNINNMLQGNCGVTSMDESLSLKSSVNVSVIQQLVCEKNTLNEGFTQLTDVVRAMMEQYVYEGSVSQVNFPGRLRVQLEKDVAHWLDSATMSLRKTLENDTKELEVEVRNSESRKIYFHAYSKGLIIPKDLFVKAKSECYMIMRKDTFARWRFTDQFSTFSDSLQPLANAKHNNEIGTSNNSGIVGPVPMQVSVLSSASMMRQQSLLPGKLSSNQQLGQKTFINNQNNIVLHTTLEKEKC